MKRFSEITAPLPRDPSRLARQRHDVVIIGGGINGAGLARDLAMRGMKTVLLDKGDFACGTSSASTKLIHGGLRYLESFHLGLVFESSRERRVLQEIAPHLVRPLPFLIPVYRKDPRSLLTIRAGLTLYDLLSLFRNTHSHRILSVRKALQREPVLQQADLTGVALYWDCRMDDARLCLENVLAAGEAGAETFSYLEVVGLHKKGGKVSGVRLFDHERRQELEVEARVVVNAAGPWLDKVCALEGEGERKLRLTRGTHILVPRINNREEALYLTAGRDDRLFFVIPWGRLSLIGTTDVDYPGDPDDVAPTEDDISYLLEEAGRHLQGLSLSRRDVVASFAGLRPLVAEEGKKAGRISREHRIFESPSGMISVGGGKYTTYRAVAAELANRIASILGIGGGPSRTDEIPLPGGACGDFQDYLHREMRDLSAEYGLSPALLEGLITLYGSRTRRVLSLLREEPALMHPVTEGSSLLGVQVAYSVMMEEARTPEDVLRRRIPLALEAGRGLKELPAVARIMGERLGSPRNVVEEWQRAYRARYSQL